ncbi:MAG: hypothetical protein ACTHZ5_06795 [Micrococcaceae bacterium]
MNFIDSLQNFVLSLPEAIQFLGVSLVAMVPFVENYGAVVIGSVAGVPVWAAVLMAIIGNLAIVAVITLIASGTREAIVARSGTGSGTEELSPRQAKVRRLFDRYGVPGVTLLGMLVVPTHFIAPALVSFGSSKTVVLVWQAISITLYAVVAGLLINGLIHLAS